jgi:hypothetical protein
MTIPEQIAAGRDPYYAALEAADKAFDAGTVDVSVMEELLKGYLGVQLASTFDKATSADAGEQMDRNFH